MDADKVHYDPDVMVKVRNTVAGGWRGVYGDATDGDPDDPDLLGRPEIGPASKYLWEKQDRLDVMDMPWDTNLMDMEGPAYQGESQRSLMGPKKHKKYRLGLIVFALVFLVLVIVYSAVVPRRDVVPSGPRSGVDATQVTDTASDTDKGTLMIGGGDGDDDGKASPGELIVTDFPDVPASGNPESGSGENGDPPKAGAPPREEAEQPIQDPVADEPAEASGTDAQPRPDAHEVSFEGGKQPTQDPALDDHAEDPDSGVQPRPNAQDAQSGGIGPSIQDLDASGSTAKEPNASHQPTPSTAPSIQEAGLGEENQPIQDLDADGRADDLDDAGAVIRINAEDLYRQVGEEVLYRLAEVYGQLIGNAKIEILEIYPYSDAEGLAYAEDALMDLLEEVANDQIAYGSDGGDDVYGIGSKQRARAYGGGYYAKHDTYRGDHRKYRGYGGYAGYETGYYGKYGGYGGGRSRGYGGYGHGDGHVEHVGYQEGREKYGGRGGYGGY